MGHLCHPPGSGITRDEWAERLSKPEVRQDWSKTALSELSSQAALQHRVGRVLQIPGPHQGAVTVHGSGRGEPIFFKAVAMASSLCSGWWSTLKNWTQWFIYKKNQEVEVQVDLGGIRGRRGVVNMFKIHWCSWRISTYIFKRLKNTHFFLDLS